MSTLPAGRTPVRMYIPYIADAMLATDNQTYFNLQFTMIFDPLLNSNNAMRQVPTRSFANECDVWDA
jgi:carboxypeptidase D